MTYLPYLYLVLLMLLSTPARAHDFYEYDCCSDRDCAPVDRATVVEGPNGYEVPSLGLTVPYGDSRHRVSQDGDYHLCVSPNTGRLLCIYAPLGGV